MRNPDRRAQVPGMGWPWARRSAPRWGCSSGRRCRPEGPRIANGDGACQLVAWSLQLLDGLGSSQPQRTAASCSCHRRCKRH
jgi:hypothetical protein